VTQAFQSGFECPGESQDSQGKRPPVEDPGKRLHQCLELSVADLFTAALMDAVHKQSARKVESSLSLK